MEFSGGGEFGGLKNGGEVFFFKGFVLQESAGEGVEDGEIGAEDGFGAGGSLVRESLHLGVDEFGGFFRVGFAGGDSVVAGVGVGEDEVAGLLAHAFGGDHLLAEFGDMTEVGAGARSDGVFTEDDFLGNAAAHSASENVFELVDVFVVAIFGREEPSDTTGAAAGDDGDFVDGVGVGEDVANDGVASFVVGGELAFVVVHDLALALGADGDAFEGLGDIGAGDGFVAFAGGGDGGFVGDVGEVGAGTAGGLGGEGVEIDVVGERLVLEVNFEDGEAVFALGQSDVDMAIEATWAEQGFVQHVHAVGGGHDDDAGIVVETVHLDEDLVQGLLVFATSATASVAFVGDSIDFVNEDDGGGVFLGFGEEVADAGGTDADEHFGELGAGDAEEGDGGLASDGAGHQGFAGAWIAREQDAARDFGAELFVFLGFFEEVNDFGEVLFGGFITSDVLEGDLFLVGAVEAGFGLAEAHGLVVHGLGLAHHGTEEKDDEDDGDDDGGGGESVIPEVGDFLIFDDRILGLAGGEFVAGEVGAVVDEALIIEGARGVFAGDLGVVVVAFQGDLEFVADDGDFGDITVCGVGASNDVGKRDFLGGGSRSEK